MTIGIYALIFNNTDKVYIGQSKNLESREISHKYKITHELSSKKLIEAYNKYGIPTFTVLCYCSLNELDKTEKEAIDIYNSVDNGFNSFKNFGGGNNTNGELHHKSKYTNEKIIEVFNLLTDNIHYTLKKISEKTNVSYSVVCEISKCANHQWLKDIFPNKYMILLNKKGNRKTISIINSEQTNKLISPNKEIFIVNNIRAFCREHNLQQSHLGKLLKGIAKSHKGWRLYKGDTPSIFPQ